MYLSSDYEINYNFNLSYTDKTISNRIEIYTDGACSYFSENNRPGGWGFLIVKNNNIIYKNCGEEEQTTNNRMEIIAILKSIEYCIENNLDNVIIYSDSDYCINTMKTWLYNWLKKDKWKNRQVPNQDLWEYFLSIKDKIQIEYRWVRGHNGNKYNEMADKLATSFRKKT